MNVLVGAGLFVHAVIKEGARTKCGITLGFPGPGHPYTETNMKVDCKRCLGQMSGRELGPPRIPARNYEEKGYR